jgi:hypothetical protein
VALHRAASNPRGAAPAWQPAADAGWRLILPHAPHPFDSTAWLWLDFQRGTLDLEAAESVVVPHVPPMAPA